MAPARSPSQEVQCTYKTCFLTFKNEAEMKNHKYVDDEHDYCKRCDYDGKDWEALLQHKVESMAPFLIGHLKNEKVKHMKHIVCEFCGEEFKSFGGRDRHRRQMHQADQHIRCPSIQCPGIFDRPSGLIDHLENGHCAFIDRREFQAQRAQKKIIKQLLEEPDAVSTSLQANQEPMRSSKFPDLLTGPVSKDERDEDGGVALDFGALQPERNLMDWSIPIGNHANDDWPQLSNELDDTLSASMSRISIGSRSSSLGKTTSSTEGYVSHPPLSSLDSRSSTRIGSDIASITTERANFHPPDNVSGSNSSMAAPTKETNWDAIAASHARTLKEEAKTNLFTARILNPTAPEYDVLLFGSPERGYHCPFPGCYFASEAAYDLSAHLRDWHCDADRVRCPCCQKNFDSTTKLVQHCEQSARGGKCRIARSDEYARVLDEITGGFLTAKPVRLDKIWGLQEGSDGKVVARVGEHGSVKGVMDTKYETLRN